MHPAAPKRRKHSRRRHYCRCSPPELRLRPNPRAIRYLRPNWPATWQQPRRRNLYRSALLKESATFRKVWTARTTVFCGGSPSRAESAIWPRCLPEPFPAWRQNASLQGSPRRRYCEGYPRAYSRVFGRSHHLCRGDDCRGRALSRPDCTTAFAAVAAAMVGPKLRSR